MRFIPRSLHAVLDYSVGLFLATTPWTFGFPRGAATIIPIVLGLGAVLYSLLTDYEGGLIRLLPFRIHLLIDAVSAAVFLVSPFLLHMGDRVLPPFIAFGLFELCAVLFTDPNARGPVPTFHD